MVVLFFLGHVSKQYGQRHSLTLTSVFLVASESWQILKSGSIHASFNSQFCDSSLGSTEKLVGRNLSPKQSYNMNLNSRCYQVGLNKPLSYCEAKILTTVVQLSDTYRLYFFNRSQLLNCDFSNCPMTVLSLIAFLRRVPTSLESMFLPSFFITVDFF